MRYYFLLSVASLNLLLGIILFSPDQYKSDEAMHLELAEVLIKTGSMSEMLHFECSSAPGPLYQILHVAFSPLTHLSPHAVRWVNLGLVACSLVAMQRALARWQPLKSGALTSSVFAVPTVWAASGLALTDAPAWCFASLSIWVATVGIVSLGTKQLLLAGLSGLLLGLAVCGRQLLLPVIGLVFLFGFPQKTLRLPTLIFCLSAIPLPALLFWTWGGFTRPSAQIWMEGGLNWQNLSYSFGYLAITLLLIAPQWFQKRWLTYVLSGGLVMIMGFFLWNSHYLPSQSLLEPLGLSAQQDLIGRMMGSAFLGLACTCALSLGLNAWDARNNRVLLFLITTTFVLACVPISNTQLFSTRYYIATVPFSVFMLHSFFTPGWGSIARFVAGATLGVVTLYGYYR